MTVPATERKAGPFDGNGSTTDFPFEFKVFTTADIEVVFADADGVETVLDLDSDYSVSLNADQDATPGGTVTYPISGDELASGEKLSIAGALAYEQETDIPTGGNFNPTVLENALDKLSMQTQQLAEAVSRAAKVPITSAADADALTQAILVTSDNLSDLQTIVDNISDIQTVADDLNEATSEINTVAVNIANVNAVGNNISNVNTVAGNNTNVSTVATNITAVSTAATNISAIIAAPTEASNAASSATAAASSAAAAAASAASGMYSSVQDKSADYTVVAGDAGDLIRVTTTGGARTITLPAISTVTDGFKVAVAKWTGDTNTVTIARSSSDTINGAATYVLDSQYKSATFVADAETNTWFAVGSGSSATNITVDAFSGNGSTVAFTLSGDPGSENNTQVFVGGVYQEKDTYSVSGTTLTFSSAPPSGSTNIEVVWAAPLAIGTPSDGTVGTAKLVDAAVTPAKLDRTYAALSSAQSFTAAQRGAISALTDAATITPDFALANNFSVTLGGSRTLANPTNLTAGQSGIIVITQDGTGSRTLAYGSYWKFPTGTAPTLTTTASAVDVLAYYVESSTRITARLIGDVK